MLVLVVTAAAVTADVVGNVYFGNPRNYRNPAELEAAKVFQVIPEYQELLRQKLETSDPRYWSLMDKANTRFIRALVSVAKKYNYDLIGEKGFLGRQNVTDITLVVLDEIQGIRPASNPPCGQTAYQLTDCDV
jgi:hypothetical protein